MKMESSNKEKEREYGSVKVMSDEQMEVLRQQISVFVLISEQLASLHNSLSSQQHLSLSGSGYDVAYSGGGGLTNRMSCRQRWSPTPTQLQKLENIFEQGHGTPTKQRIKNITKDLAEDGQISETNVYNWFQNRRARSKRKPQNNQPPPIPPQSPHPQDFMTWSESATDYQVHLPFPSWPPSFDALDS